MVTYHYVKIYVSIIIQLEVINYNNKTIIRNGAKTISLQMLFGRLNK